MEIDYSATTDKATPVSMTNHTYFNLNGFQDKILGHTAQIASDKFLVPDETNVPVGEEFPVAGSVWDYNTAKPVGDAFTEEPKGFEHYYVFSKPVGSFDKVAEFKDPASGRTLEVSSSDPGMLFYTGFYTSDELNRESGASFGQFRAFCCETARYPNGPFGQFRAFCCETARYPNGPNIEGAPDCILRPGDTYQGKTTFKLGW
jgi:aldose 1-epimerase